MAEKSIKELELEYQQEVDNYFEALRLNIEVSPEGEVTAVNAETPASDMPF